MDTPEPKAEGGPEDTRRMKAVLVLTAAILFAAAPFAVPFNGVPPDLYPIPQENPPVQPKGYAFSIWGVIYLWLIASAGFGLVKRSTDPAWDRMRWPLFGSIGLGAGWLSVASVNPLLATLMIWAMLGLALAALFVAPRTDRWWGQAPIALYAGWLTAASWVSIGLLGAGYGIGPGPVGWAVICLLAATGMTVLIQWSLGRAPEYSAPIVWAFVAIAVANAASVLWLTVAAGAAAVIVAVWALRPVRTA